jgi:DNA-binding transcriptional regulator/RsmH inhibitor MraZ
VETSPDQVNPSQPPLGIYSSRCDDKGRIRLPKEFEEFLGTFPDPRFFVTSLDGRIGRIYPIQTWRENEKVFEEYEEDPQAAEDIGYVADRWGGVSGIDGQGRMLVPPDLRRKIEIEDSKVFMRFYRGAVEIYSEAESERRMQRATEALAANLPALRKKGLK